MKKKMMGLIAVVVIAVVAGFNVYRTQIIVDLSTLALVNVEALAGGETEGTCTARVSCGGGGPNDFVECSGRVCERHATVLSRWVKCDGIKTSC